MARNLCSVCGEPADITLAFGDLCARCDSLGRIAAAKVAYQTEQHRQAVSRGYGGNVTAGSSAIHREDAK